MISRENLKISGGKVLIRWRDFAQAELGVASRDFIEIDRKGVGVQGEPVAFK